MVGFMRQSVSSVYQSRKLFGSKSWYLQVRNKSGSSNSSERVIRSNEQKFRWENTRTKGQWMMLFSGPILLTFGLGTWQIQRLQQKYTLIEERYAKLNAPPLNSNASALFDESQSGKEQDPTLQYRRIRLKGTLLDEKSVLVGPRSAPEGVPQGVLQWGGSVGSSVITPFVLDEENTDGEPKPERIVLLNRGWIPHRLLDEPRETWDEFAKNQVEKVEIQAIVGKSGKPNNYTPDNVPEKGKWYYLDAEQLAHAMGIQSSRTPPILEVIASRPDAKVPYRKRLDEYASFYTKPQTHIDYAVTWYVLCAILTVWCVTMMRKAKPKSVKSPVH
mmetsp:Transcript_3156/g.5550  ORF Transcript_3156/g.5550 Transcript_3156/m.5550 type:complete len:331 (-) Transcript_3156:379-1371(-)